MKINIIGDIAGRYDELMKLLAKMPEADLILSVGDMVDRGPQSKQVIEFFMTNPKAEAVYGNHEDMMVEGVKLGQTRDWLHNGGKATLESYKDAAGNVNVDADHIEWLEKRPLWYATDDLIVSHAPISTFNLDDIPEQYSRDYYFVWNRYPPRKRQPKFMIYGHNGKLQMHSDDQGDYAMCLDNSHRGELTGIHWPTKEIFTQEFREIEAYNKMTDEEKAAYKKKLHAEEKKRQAALRMFL